MSQILDRTCTAVSPEGYPCELPALHDGEHAAFLNDSDEQGAIPQLRWTNRARREDAAGERLAQIAARLNAATPGPWEWQGKRLNGGPANAVGVVSHGAAWDVSKPDAEFIAHSRSDVEYLLAARREVEEATQLLGSIRKHCRVVYYYPRPSSNYPIEHAPHARKDCWDMIVAALAATPEEK